MIADLTPGMLAGKRFVFGTPGQRPWSERLILSENGTVSGYQHPNEAAWYLRDGNLCLTTVDGKVTTKFDLVTFDDGQLSFQGRIPETNGPVHCLTEFRLEARPPASVAIENPLNDVTGHDFAVLIRSHKCDAKYQDLKQKLERNRSDFDLYSIVDETKGRQNIPDVNVVWHSLDACRELGLSHDHPGLLYYCSDLPFYFALRELPRYKHYLLIEDDVDMLSGDASFLNELARLLRDRPEVDFAGLHFSAMDPKSRLYSVCSKFLPNRALHYAFFPFVILSRRAAAYLFSQRLIEAARKPDTDNIMYCEGFAASVLMAGGYNCFDLNTLRPRSYAFASMAMHIGDTNIGRTMGYDMSAELPEPVEMVHPVYTTEEHAERAHGKFIIYRGNDHAGLATELASPWAANIPRHIKDEMIAGKKPRFGASDPRGSNSGNDRTNVDDAHITPGAARVLSLTFGSNGNDTHYLANGWSSADPGGRWMTGDVSEIWLENPGPDHDLALELELFPFMPDRKPQRLEIAVRGETVLQVTVVQAQVVGALIKSEVVRTPGPIRIVLRHPDHRRPANREDTRSVSFAATALRLSRILPRPSPTGGAPLPIGELMTHFESLGDNCELGMAQRHSGVEPLGLLRFSYISLWQLLRGLRNDFAGISEAEKLLVHTDPPPEYVVVQKDYGIRYHSGVNEDEATAEQVLARQPTRLKFLSSKLLNDIASAEKIFVIKRTTPNLRFDEVLPVWTALNERGQAWLLWVTPADDGHPPGHVEIVMPGLLRGYTDTFAGPGGPEVLILPAWQAACAAAWALVGS